MWFRIKCGACFCVLRNSATPTTVSTTRRQLAGLAAGTTSRTVATDIHGNETVSTTAIDRANKTLVQTTDLPDSSVDEQSVTVNGLLVSSRSSSNLTTTYAYDALERQAAVTDPRTGATTIAYFASGTGKTGQVQSVTDPADNTTTFDYDSATGRRTSVTNALGKATTYAYNDRGQITAVRGDASYPLDYEYDNYGRMVQLKTYRSDPSDPSNADITTWAYHLPTGLLTSKTYADSKAVSYTYSSDGKLATRTWARFGVPPSGGLLTSYSYNAATGELTGIDYSDSTPDVAFSYNRLGQQKTVSDVVGTRTFSYNPALQLSSEAIDGSSGGLYSKTLSRSYATAGVIGRYTGMNVGTEYTVGYGYDAHGRPGSLTAGSDTFTYSYLANSDLPSVILYPSSISAARSYEPNRDLITGVEHKHDTTVVSNYFYENDVIGRRRFMEKSGTAFAFHPQTDRITYEYNDRSEVVGAESSLTATYEYGYAFDPIGNRLTSTSKETGTPVARNYTSNVLNQYTAIDYPSVTPSYDDDGNMTSLPVSTGTWACTWDAENRLVAMEKATQRLEFKYDYASRRVEKKVFAWDTDHWSLITDYRFVYDGFLQIEKLNSADSNALLVTRAWTGVEGYDRLIAETHVTTGNTYYALADANKNLTCYLTNAGAIAGHFEFSPFGQITRETGGLSDQFDFRFSSEFFEQETGLVYYNFRYYSPELGRWLGRDPSWEKGGNNLNHFVYNTPIIMFDVLGLFTDGYDDYYMEIPSGKLKPVDDIDYPEKPEKPAKPSTPSIADEFVKETFNSIWEIVPKSVIPINEAIGTEQKKYGAQYGHDPFVGDYRHCLAACLITRRCGPIIGSTACWYWDRSEDDPADSEAGWEGVKLGSNPLYALISCESLCEKAIKRPGRGR
jgi:RHS repeat-associated protein